MELFVMDNLERSALQKKRQFAGKCGDRKTKLVAPPFYETASVKARCVGHTGLVRLEV